MIDNTFICFLICIDFTATYKIKCFSRKCKFSKRLSPIDDNVNVIEIMAFYFFFLCVKIVGIRKQNDNIKLAYC